MKNETLLLCKALILPLIPCWKGDLTKDGMCSLPTRAWPSETKFKLANRQRITFILKQCPWSESLWSDMNWEWLLFLAFFSLAQFLPDYKTYHPIFLVKFVCPNEFLSYAPFPTSWQLSKNHSCTASQILLHVQGVQSQCSLRNRILLKAWLWAHRLQLLTCMLEEKLPLHRCYWSHKIIQPNHTACFPATCKYIHIQLVADS